MPPYEPPQPPQPFQPDRRRRYARWWLAALVLIVAWLAIGTSVAFFRGRIGDFPVFYHAAEAIVEGEDIYASHVRGYLYPPIFAIALVPFTLLDLSMAAGIWALVNGVMLLAAVVLLASDAARVLGRSGDPLVPAAAALLGLAMIIDKARASLMMGQTDTLVLFLVALALHWLARRPLISGPAIAAAILVKYQALVFLPYLLLRRRRSELVGVLAFTALLLLAPAILFGWERNAHYLSQSLGVLGAVVGLQPENLIAGPHPMTWDRSVSVSSAIARIAGDAGVSPTGVLALVALAAVVALAIGWLLFRIHAVPLFVLREHPIDDPRWPRRLLEPAGLIVGALVFSPQTEGRHMLLAAVLTIPTWAMIITAARNGVRLRLVLAMLILVAGITLPPGGPAWSYAVAQWRHIGGASICLLVAYFVVLNEALSWPPPAPASTQPPGLSTFKDAADTP